MIADFAADSNWCLIMGVTGITSFVIASTEVGRSLPDGGGLGTTDGGALVEAILCEGICGIPKIEPAQ